MDPGEKDRVAGGDYGHALLIDAERRARIDSFPGSQLAVVPLTVELAGDPVRIFENRLYSAVL